MLLHVTMTHRPEECPSYNHHRLPELLAAFDKMEVLAKELGVKSHYFVWSAPEHFGYALIETDHPAKVARYFGTIPFKHDFKVTPVQHLQEFKEYVRSIVEHK